MAAETLAASFLILAVKYSHLYIHEIVLNYTIVNGPIYLWPLVAIYGSYLRKGMAVYFNRYVTTDHKCKLW